MTVEFQVGVPRQTAIVRLYNQVFQNQGFVPPGLGVGPPLVRPMGIDDVPVMALTLWSDDPAHGPVQLAEVAHTLERSEEHTSELQSLMRISYAVFCSKKKTKRTTNTD